MKTHFNTIAFLLGALGLFLLAFPSDTLAATVTLSWGASTESDLAGYKVYYGASPRTGICPPGGYPSSVNAGNVTTYTVGGLANGQTYYFSVSAYDTSGNESCFSSEVSQATPITTITPPTIMTPLTISITSPVSAATVSGSAVTVSASASDNVGVAGVRFKLDGINLGSEDTASPYSASWNTTLTANGAHVLTATARNTAGNQATSPSVIVAVNNVNNAICDATSPSIPTNLSLKVISSSQINLAWTASTDNVGVAGYRIYRNNTQIVTVNALSYQNTGLSPSTTYTYTVSAYDAAGKSSGLSVPVSATTLSLLSTPTSTPTVKLPTVITFTVPYPYSIIRGSSIRIQWEVTNAVSVVITPNIGGEPLPLKGSRTIQPQVTTTYTLTATNAVGAVSRKVTETVIVP